MNAAALQLSVSTGAAFFIPKKPEKGTAHPTQLNGQYQVVNLTDH